MSTMHRGIAMQKYVVRRDDDKDFEFIGAKLAHVSRWESRRPVELTLYSTVEGRCVIEEVRYFAFLFPCRRGAHVLKKVYLPQYLAAHDPAMKLLFCKIGRGRASPMDIGLLDENEPGMEPAPLDNMKEE